MKLRTSFFDKTVLKKDLTRFFPLWVLYLIGGLLIMHTATGFYDSYYDTHAYHLAQELTSVIGPMGIFSGIYGFLCAQLVFGDLHNTRLCYGLHALPLRRESWYATHVVSGLLMGLAPTLIIALTVMPFLGKFWFTALLCFGGIALHYLFFFALAVFCMMCTGNRFASTAIYSLLNFLSLIVQWFVKTVYLPLLPGVRSSSTAFNYFCPVVNLTGLKDFFTLEHPETCPCYDINHLASSYFYEYEGPHTYVFEGLGRNWGYLWILAGIGVLLLALGLILYRHRHLERAGDFMVFKPMKPIFLTIYSMCVAAILYMLGEGMGDTSTGFLFFAVGTAIGYFTGRMLLERTLRVFGRKNLIGMGILYGAVILSLLLTWVDPIGISRRIPDSQKVEKVYLYDGHLSDYQLNNLDRFYSHNDIIIVTDPEDIAEICDVHHLMLREHNTTTNNSRFFTLRYELKNGTSFTRSYDIPSYGKAWQSLKPYLTKPSYLFSASSLESLQQITQYVYSSELGEIPERFWPELLQAMWLDAQSGYLSTNGSSVSGKDLMYIELRLGMGNFRALYFTEDAPLLSQWFKQYGSSPQLLLHYDSLEDLQNAASHVFCTELDLELNKDEFPVFLELLWQDCQNGLVSSYGKWNSGIMVEVQTQHTYLSLRLTPDSESLKWLIDKSGSNQ